MPSEKSEELNSTQKAINMIPSIKADLCKAIESIRLPHDLLFDPQSYLDFAILISLYYLEIHIIDRVTSGIIGYPVQIENLIKENNYSKLDMDEKVKEVLEYLNDLRDIRENDTDEIKEEIYTKEYADKYRKGLRVIHFGQLCQYRMYCKGLYF